MQQDKAHPPYLSYDPRLTEKARENRKNPTQPERILWNKVLRNREFENLKFTRQKPLDLFIVDFYCAELTLAIEVDGDSHAENEAYDRERTLRLNQKGITVLRFTNEDVMHRLEGVYQVLSERIQELRKITPLAPLVRGEK
jgi:very-short-patch-repair endonuclease